MQCCTWKNKGAFTHTISCSDLQHQSVLKSLVFNESWRFLELDFLRCGDYKWESSKVLTGLRKASGTWNIVYDSYETLCYDALHGVWCFQKGCKTIISVNTWKRASRMTFRISYGQENDTICIFGWILSTHSSCLIRRHYMLKICSTKASWSLSFSNRVDDSQHSNFRQCGDYKWVSSKLQAGFKKAFGHGL